MNRREKRTSPTRSSCPVNCGELSSRKEAQNTQKSKARNTSVAAKLSLLTAVQDPDEKRFGGSFFFAYFALFCG